MEMVKNVSYPLSLYQHNSEDPRATKLRFPAGVPEAKVAKYKLPALPSLNHSLDNKVESIPVQRERILELFDSNNTCAIFLGYPGCLDKRNLRRVPKLPFDYRRLTGEELFSSVFDAVKQPVCVRDAAKAFVENMFSGEKFVAIHWRFDLNDWGRLKEIKPSTIENLKAFNASDVATGVRTALRSLAVSYENVFIAAIPTTRPFAVDFGRLLGFNRTVVNSEEFVREKYKNDLEEHGWHFEDFASMVDQELCERSAVFFFSIHSTWSEIVRLTRNRERRQPEFSIYRESLKSFQAAEIKV